MLGTVIILHDPILCINDETAPSYTPDLMHRFQAWMLFGLIAPDDSQKGGRVSLRSLAF